MKLLEEFTIPLSELLMAPYITYNYLKELNPDLKKPSISGHKELCLFCGFTNEAYRTQLSRSKRKKELIVDNFKGIQTVIDVSRYLNLSNYYQGIKLNNSYTLLIFSFPTGESKNRYRLKELLKNIKFSMINPNAYISWNADNSKLNTLLDNEGFKKNTQVFTNIISIPQNTIEALKVNLNLNEWNEKVKRFILLSENFLEEYNNNHKYRLFAIIAVTLSFYINILVPAPNLPGEIFRSSSLISDMNNLYFKLFNDEIVNLSSSYKLFF